MKDDGKTWQTGDCINAGGTDPADACEGAVELREALSASRIPYKRCDKHWAARLIMEAELQKRYPAEPPADFDPLYAGERWNEDDPWP